MDNIIDSDDIFVQFAANIWNQVESCMDPKIQIHEEVGIFKLILYLGVGLKLCGTNVFSLGSS